MIAENCSQKFSKMRASITPNSEHGQSVRKRQVTPIDSPVAGWFLLSIKTSELAAKRIYQIAVFPVFIRVAFSYTCSKSMLGDGSPEFPRPDEPIQEPVKASSPVAGAAHQQY